MATDCRVVKRWEANETLGILDPSGTMVVRHWEAGVRIARPNVKKVVHHAARNACLTTQR